MPFEEKIRYLLAYDFGMDHGRKNNTLNYVEPKILNSVC